MTQDQSHWSENVIVADADYVDGVAFHLTVNFERMLGRRIPKADLARWLVCVALDGGLRPAGPAAANNDDGTAKPLPPAEVSVVLVHRKAKLENFVPADCEHELNGQAFADPVGEFAITCCPVETIVDNDQLFLDVLDVVLSQPGVKRLMLIPNAEQTNMVAHIRERLRHAAANDCHVTLFAMQPVVGGSFGQEILGYSLMAALGIKGEEITNSL